MVRGGRSAKSRADAAAQLQRAGQLLEQGEHASALPLLQAVAPVLALPAVEAAIGDCLLALGRPDEALRAYRDGLVAHPGSGDLALRLAGRGLEAGRFDEALRGFRIAAREHRKDAAFLRAFAYAALQTETWTEAEEKARAALALAPGAETTLLLGLAQAGQGRFADAAATLEESSDGAVQALAARFHAVGGNLGRAQTLYQAAEARGGLAASDWAPASQVAALTGERAQAERYLTQAERLDPGTATQLAAAQLALLLDQPERALAALQPLAEITDAVDRALVLALTGRAHRLAAQIDLAHAALDQIPTSAPPRVQVLALVDRGHLHAQAGAFERAEEAFRAALQIDASHLEAIRGLERAAARLSWQRGVLQSAQEQVEAARAEATAVRLAVAEREGELVRLKRQLQELERARQASEREAQAQAQAALAQATQARDEEKRALQRELEAREEEVRTRTEEEIALAFGGRVEAVPAKLVEGLRVAERTYQKALQTDLPGAGVAVLFTGVLERALYLCIVAELERHLDDDARREAFLSGARQGTGRGRYDYLDHFVGAFDREHPLRAPGLGEVARALRKRSEPHLLPLRAFLEEVRGYSGPFLDALAAFIDQSKTRLRDPVAHGRVLEIDDADVARFRHALMRGFEGGPGVLHRLVFPAGG
jgi:Flp pilus assembly protein TadD